MLETLACLKRKERCAVLFKAEWSNTNSSWYFFLLNQLLLIPRNQSGLSGMKVTTVGPVMSSAGSDRRCFASPANHNTLYSGQPHFTLYLFSDMPNVENVFEKIATKRLNHHLFASIHKIRSLFPVSRHANNTSCEIILGKITTRAPCLWVRGCSYIT